MSESSDLILASDGQWVEVKKVSRGYYQANCSNRAAFLLISMEIDLLLWYVYSTCVKIAEFYLPWLR